MSAPLPIPIDFHGDRVLLVDRKGEPFVPAKPIRYQHECDDVLWRHWSGRAAARREPEPAPTAAAAGTVAIPTAEYVALLQAKIALLEATTKRRPKRAPSRPLTAQERDEMRRLRAAGWTVTEIARHLGRSSATVSFTVRDVVGEGAAP